MGLSLGWGVGYLPVMLEPASITTVVIDQSRLDNEESNLLWSINLAELQLGVCYDE
tara:strand:- start:1421 stop:1588 length:168 start_codon:yes stop_codon:yes gene_type:complete